MGLSAALSMAARSLEIFSTGIQVSGNNIANASTPGAVRDKLTISTAPALPQGNLLVGGGALAYGVRQQINAYLEKRIYSANGEAEGSSARESAWKQLETALQELGTGDVSTGLTGFLGTLNDVVNQPENTGNRQLAIQQGVQLAATIQGVRLRIDELRESSNQRVDDLVSEVNSLLDQVAALGPRIANLEGGGVSTSDAGGLRTQRLAALNRLSEILPIRTVDQATGTVDVYVGSEPLIIDGQVQHLETGRTIDRNVAVNMVEIAGSNMPLSGTQGELNGLLNGRDTVLGGFSDKLDALASSFIFEFNKLHASGQGTKGFTSVTGTYRAGTTTAALNAAGLDFAPQNGSFLVKVTNTVTGAVTTSRIEVDLDGIGSDTTLTGLSSQIDGLANVTSTITADRRLTIAAGSGYEIQFADDSSNALAALGINTFFTGADSQSIGVNALLTTDPGYFAAGSGGGPGDGTNALRLAHISDSGIAALGDVTFDEFYRGSLSQVAQGSASESAMAEGNASFRDTLLSQREQYSGISLDEEVVQILQYQRAYQMSGRYISTIDELFRTLLQM